MTDCIEHIIEPHIQDLGGFQARRLLPSNARCIVVGGESVGKRHKWWNFVSSRLDRIEQAKHDWREGRFGQVPDETEFIPLPEESNRKEGQPLEESLQIR